MPSTRLRSVIPPRRSATRAARRSRRLLLILVVALAMILLGQHLRTAPARPATAPRVAMTAPATTSAAPRAKPVRGAVAVAGTSGRFAYVAGSGKVLGTAGPIRRFKVAVEEPIGESAAADFAREVDEALGDRRSWIAAKRFRLLRVPRGAYAEFTVFLASARTSERMCRTGGLATAGFTSCRLPRQVIINDDRWRIGVPRYGAALTTYRQYAINHEVGHQFGHGHETCPGRGRPAPVMMQQTYGLRGCTANAWPYPHGRRYAGPAVS